jgi:hypothetical protein
MARAPVSKTGGWGFESLHSCQAGDPKLMPRLTPSPGWPGHSRGRYSSAMTAAKGLIKCLIGQSKPGLA